MNKQLYISYKNQLPNFSSSNNLWIIKNDLLFNKPIWPIFWTSTLKNNKTSAWFEFCRKYKIIYRKNSIINGYIFNIVNNPKILQISNQDDVNKILKLYSVKWKENDKVIDYEKLFKTYDIIWMKLRKYENCETELTSNNYYIKPFINWASECMAISNPWKWLKLEKVIKIVI